jgi:hypothetical protein
MSVVFETKPQANISVPGGQTRTIIVKIPPRSFISKLVVVQQTGGIAGFTVEMFNHADALEGTQQSESSSDADGDKIPLSCYRVGSPLVELTDELLYFSDEATGGHGLAFFCQDAPRADRQGQHQGNLYIRITPGGSGAKTFALVVGGEQLISGV